MVFDAATTHRYKQYFEVCDRSDILTAQTLTPSINNNSITCDNFDIVTTQMLTLVINNNKFLIISTF